MPEIGPVKSVGIYTTIKSKLKQKGGGGPASLEEAVNHGFASRGTEDFPWYEPNFPLTVLLLLNISAMLHYREDNARKFRFSGFIYHHSRHHVLRRAGFPITEVIDAAPGPLDRPEGTCPPQPTRYVPDGSSCFLRRASTQTATLLWKKPRYHGHRSSTFINTAREVSERLVRPRGFIPFPTCH